MTTNTPTNSQEYSFLKPPKHPGDLGTLGNYRILGELGKGGMGFVFRAEDTVLERSVALKVMNAKIASTANSRERFIQEARAMAAVHQDNVVVIFEVGTEDGTPFMAMEMLRGETLEAVNARKDARDFRKVIDYASQISRGLAAAHAKGIVHRDIKPANIWIEEGSGRVKILDFGLALAQSPLDEFTGVGSVCGTPGYLTPEQARSDALDDRSDLYSLGVVLYEMCTGRLPIQCAAIAEQLVGLLAHAPKPLRDLNPEIPQPLADMIHQLLAKEPGERPASAIVLEQQLKTVAIECESKTETALSLNKLQESLKEVVSKQATEVEEPVEVVQEMPMPTFDMLDPLSMPSPAAGLPAATGLPGPAIGTPKPTVQRIKPATGRPAAKTTAQGASTVSPVVWIASGIVATLALVGFAVWMILPGQQETFVVRPENNPTTNTTNTIPKPPPKKPAQPKPARNPGGPNQNRRNSNAANRKNNQGTNKNGNQSNKTKGQGSNNVSSMPKPKLPTVSQPAPTPKPPAATPKPPAADQPKPKPVESGPTKNLLLSTALGIGADSTVRLKSPTTSLGMKTSLAVHMKSGEERQHVYLRFDLNSLAVDRKTILQVALSMTLMKPTVPPTTELRLYGTDAAAAEKWREEGPAAITWGNSFSRSGLDGKLPVLVELKSENLIVRERKIFFTSDKLTEFVKESKGRSVTLAIAGGNPEELAVLFVSREKNPELAPMLVLKVKDE